MNLLVDTPTIPSSAGGMAIVNPTNPPKTDTIWESRTFLAERIRIINVFQGIPPKIWKVQIGMFK